ncbi:MAG: BON domain-containing protein, partial [Acidobacteria bacterium]|nr:BON domain-containing protein [Acidobacteriota bacterium]
MANETIFCAGCGITMVSFMKVCPRCGTERKEVKPLEVNPAMIVAAGAKVAAVTAAAINANQEDSPASSTSVIPLNAIRQEDVHYDRTEFAPPQNFVLLSPNDEQRRFPLFTRAQLSLIAVGVLLVLLAVIVAVLLWRQQRNNVVSVANAAAAQAPAAMTSLSDGNLTPEASPTPGDDAALFESIKTALMAYNPIGFPRYNFEVKEGIVTLNGEAEHQPEKDGAENVVRLVIGVKSVVNNLQIKPNSASEPVKLNLAEAKLLDEAMRRQMQESQPGAAETQVAAAPTPDAQREADRLRREQLAAKQRDEDAALRLAAEEKLKREAEAYEKRLEELRRAEAERRARAEQARIDAATLRYGTIAWSGIVDGVDEIILSGSSASVRHLSGN